MIHNSTSLITCQKNMYKRIQISDKDVPKAARKLVTDLVNLKKQERIGGAGLLG